MSKRLLRTAMALGIAALALSFAGSVQAQATSTNSAVPPIGSKPRPQRHQYTGDIASIDCKGRHRHRQEGKRGQQDLQD